LIVVYVLQNQKQHEEPRVAEWAEDSYRETMNPSAGFVIESMLLVL